MILVVRAATPLLHFCTWKPLQRILSGHLESFRPVALPGNTWNTEHWLSALSRGLGAESMTSPRLPIKSEYQGHFNQ